MNVEIFARIKPTVGVNSGSSTLLKNANVLSDRDNEVQFRQVLSEQETTQQVFTACAEPLVELLLSGYDCCLLVVGSMGSGRSFTLVDGVSPGLMSEAFDHLFMKIDEGAGAPDPSQSAPASLHSAIVGMQMFEMFELERTHDLLNVSNSGLAEPQIDESPEKGFYVKGLQNKFLQTSEDAKREFREAWKRRQIYVKDTGSTATAVFVCLDLTLTVQDLPKPQLSHLTVAILPAAESLTSGDSTTEIISLKPVSQLISELCVQAYPNRVIHYKQSALTKLLRNALGGNCVTNVLACFHQTSPELIQKSLLGLCRNTAQVKNFPSQHDSAVQQLCTQYRAQIMHLEQLVMQEKTHVADLKKENELLKHRSNVPKEPPVAAQPERNKLSEQVSRLHWKVEQLQNHLTTMSSTKSELSAQLVESEQEKLRSTKAFIEQQIENNKLREELESSKYELTSKILALEHELQITDIDRQKHRKESESLRSNLDQLEKERKALAEDYVIIKEESMSLSDKLLAEVDKNEELTMELLNIINVRAALELEKGSPKYEVESSALKLEEQRIRALISKLSVNSKQDGNSAKRKERWPEGVERFLQSDERRNQEQLSAMRIIYEDNQLKLQQKIDNMNKDLLSSRALARERQQKISFLNARLITLTSENNELKTYNNRLQHKMKDINEEYKLRLSKYVEDVAGYVDSIRRNPVKGEENMAQYVNRMLKDLKGAHRAREEQLSQATQNYKAKMEAVVRRHEELLCAYRDLREQVEARGLDGLDLGPDEHELVMSDADLHSSQQKEILQLQAQIHQLKVKSKQQAEEEDIYSDRAKATVKQTDVSKNLKREDDQFADFKSWTDVRRQLRQFSQSSLRGLEDERATLVTKNAILEEQLQESQEYIDKHLIRYKEEITRLRQQLGAQNGRRKL